MNAKVTVSLPSSLLVLLDRLAQKWNTTRSGAVAELLKLEERNQLVKELEEGYVAISEANKIDAELFLPSQSEILTNDDN